MIREASISACFYSIFLLTLFAGVVLYDLTGFKSADEICGLLLLVLFLYTMFQANDWPINRLFLLTLGIFFFYTCYSFSIHSNSAKAIGLDLIIQMKPYLAFFCAYQLMPVFSGSQKKILKDLCLLSWFLFLPLGIAGFVDIHVFKPIIGHPSNYAAVVSCLALTYLYCGKQTLREKIIFLVMLSAGIASGRSKFYGFFIWAAFLVFYMGKVENWKLNLRNVAIVLLLLAVVFVIARHKIEFYFLQGIGENAEDKDNIARFVLYATSFLLFADYFPFGTGLASFGTHASAVYYSDIYPRYQIDSIWGLSKSYGKFITDTYYPSLAQFGVTGVVLFVLFWIYILRKSVSYGKKSGDSRLFTITGLIVGYLLIENIADASFTSNRGFFMMILLGLVAAGQKRDFNEQPDKKGNAEPDKEGNAQPDQEGNAQPDKAVTACG